ncbi:MAG: hypothetical protein A2049_04065 [Elusimicrobia bacterium GWA2_62_23]|nr:MAG: hypothetical protein A2049_04065 [Elusimicrobia bacterium GWA2_62_23]
MKKFNLIALMAVVALATTSAYAREASFEEMLGGDSASVVHGLNAPDAEQKISFPVPAGMESCKYASVQGDVCSFICKSGATVTRPRLNSSVAQNGGCALFVMVPVQKAAKDLFDGPKETPVENPQYVCQASGGGYAIATTGAKPRIWQIGGLSEGAKSGLELASVAVTPGSRPGKLEASGTLTFFGETLKVGLSLNPDAKNGGKPSMTATLNGEAALKDVPCQVYNSGAKSEPGRSAAKVYAEGHLYAYNRATKKYDTDMFLRCSVTLNNFKSYLDTQHGSPREVVSADYRLGGFPELAKYAAGNAVASAPDQYSDYANLQGYYQSGLSKGVDVNIFIDKVPSAQAFVTNPGTPSDVYVTMENSATSYFGGNGVKWGYWCDFRPK